MEDNRIYIGIDPGKNGVIGIIYNETAYCLKCPTTIAEMANEISSIKQIAPDITVQAIIEKVHSMPKQGVKSVWTFGANYGQWLGILASNKIPYVQVSPQKWMRLYQPLSKDKKERKNQLKHQAQQRFPELKITLATSDALLLAYYLKDKQLL